MRFRIGGGDRGLEESKHSLMPALCPSHPSKPALDATPILNDLRLCSFQVCLQLDSPSCSFITIYSDFYFISTNLGFAFIFFTFFFKFYKYKLIDLREKKLTYHLNWWFLSKIIYKINIFLWLYYIYLSINSVFFYNFYGKLVYLYV